MYAMYRFLYHLLKSLPFKSRRMERFADVLRFYYKHNNLIILCENGGKIVNPLKVPNFIRIKTYLGSHDNTIQIAQNQKAGSYINLELHDAKSMNIEIGKDNKICMNIIVQGVNGVAKIGNNNQICGADLYLYCSGITSFNIGNGNLFSDKIVFWAGEGHSVIDETTKQVTNSGGNIIIGDDNWVCMNVCFLKYAKLSNGCIVGYGSVVGKDYRQYNKCIIAGNPASVVKQNVLWSDKAPWNCNGELYLGQKNLK